MKPLVLIGGGGHCKSVIDVAESAGYRILGVLDKPELVGTTVLGYPVLGTDDDIPQYVDQAEFVVTVGQIKSAALRIKLHRMVEEAGGRIATIVAPTAHVSANAKIGDGFVVLHHAAINADASIGRGCIINTFSNIEHDVKIGDYCHISTGVMVNGGVQVGSDCFIGSQAVCVQGVTIVDNTVIGSGAVVVKDISEAGTYVGSPAKLVGGGKLEFKVQSSKFKIVPKTHVGSHSGRRLVA